ncbi:MAG: hypothetical protein JNL88_06695 [Bacteroidia bacterium]|nr:hypothetical protein [Bacteroidia bacterium]
MKKIMIVLAFCFGTFACQAQVEGEVTPMELGDAPVHSYASLLYELQQNIRSDAYGSGADKLLAGWNPRKTSIKEAAAQLAAIEFNLKTNLLRPEWSAGQKEWRSNLKTTGEKTDVLRSLKTFELGLKDEAFLKTWTPLRDDWRRNLEKLLTP